MKFRPVLKWLVRALIVVFVIAAILVGIACLPGSIEGTYRGTTCMCDSVNVIRFQNGRVVFHESAHPPAQLMGRYEIAPDGATDVFLYPSKLGEKEKLWFRAFPHLWFTRAVDAESGSVDWLVKRPLYGVAKQSVEQQEIVSTVLREDDSLVKTYYSRNCEVLREEIVPPRLKKPASK